MMLTTFLDTQKRSRITTDDTSLVKRLWLGVLGTILLVLLACGGIVYSLYRLESEVTDWSQMEKVDAKREVLQRTVAQAFNGKVSDNPELMVQALSDLYGEIRQTDTIDDGLFAAQAGGMLALARRQFNTSLQTDLHWRENQGTLIQAVGRLNGRTLQMQQELERTSTTTDSDLAALENAQSAVSERQIMLGGWLSAAMQLQLSLDRLTGSLSYMLDEQTLSKRISFDMSSMPGPCSSPETGSEGTSGLDQCSDVLIELHDAFAKLEASDWENLYFNTTNAQRALTRFDRAVNAEYVALAQKNITLLAKQQELRDLTVSLEYAENVLDFMSRSLLQIEGAAGAARLSLGVKERVKDNAIPFLFARMRFGSNALLRSKLPNISTYATLVRNQTGILENSWQELNTLLDEHEGSFVEFDSSMSLLGKLISEKTDTIRRDALHWVSLFATISFVSAAIALIMTLSAAVFARRNLIQPLAKVTAAILDLANGKLLNAIQIPHRAFGFHRIGIALEDLRCAMNERQELASRNEQQTDLIQKNLEKLEKTTHEMQWLAMHDPLTGLGNRRAADEHILRLTEDWEAGWETGRPPDYCLIHLDIDHFKDINDTLGHDAGDVVLGRVANALKAATQNDAKAYRIGGDEFLIIVTRNVTRDAIEPMVCGLLKTLSEPTEYKGHVCQTGGSFGLAFGSDAEGDAQTALSNADVALYESKRAGRGTYRFFTDKLRQGMRRKTALANRLRNAVEEAQFVPFYQPQFHAHDLSLRGVETLCRWMDPEEGLLPPAQFLDIAEELHLMGDIDQQLFYAAARDLEYLHNHGLHVPRISFNVTAQRLAQSNLAEDLTRTITGDTQIVVELLESMSLDSLSDTVRFSIDALKEAGIMVEVDDFGSCRASIAGLISVGPDAMKIDRSIVQPLSESDQHLQLIKSIIQIGKTLGIEVVAEGVEAPEHVRILSELGCDALQGFALGRPMPLEALEKFLRQGGNGGLLLSA